jgi:hypothetical protein
LPIEEERLGAWHFLLEGPLVVRWSPRARWLPAPQAGVSVLPEIPPEHGDFTAPIQATITRVRTPAIVYAGFHYYEAAEGGRRQLDFGLNPLASYPLLEHLVREPGANEAPRRPTGAI